MVKTGLAGSHADPEQRRETGTTFILVGWLFLIFAALALFFKATVPHQGDTLLVNFAILLGAAGVVLYVLGRIIRHRAK